MSEPIAQVKTAFDRLLDNISKPRRRLLYQQIGRELARSQRRRIKAQQNPDGTAYAPRKAPKKKVKSKIKQGTMFEKISTPRFMRLRTENEGVSLGYEGGNAVIARIHQQGLVGNGEDKGFAYGGYTSNGGKYDPAGIVALASSVAFAQPQPTVKVNSRPPLTASQPSHTTPASQNIHITINAAEGQNPQDIARLVAMEFAKTTTPATGKNAIIVER